MNKFGLFLGGVIALFNAIRFWGWRRLVWLGISAGFFVGLGGW